MSARCAQQTDAPSAAEDAGIWCARMSEGPLSVVDAAALREWLETDPGNREQLALAQLLWSELDQVASTPEIISHRQKALMSFRKAQQKRWHQHIKPYWLWGTGAAAALVLAFGANWSLSRPVIYETGLAHRSTVTLSDGSIVALDADTRVEVHYASRHRDIRLDKGRASFTVAHDKTRPFSVSTGAEVVVATGTAFSVERLSQQVRVVLFEGRVKVLHKVGAVMEPQLALNASGEATDAGRLLVPGKQLMLTTGAGSVKGTVAQVMTVAQSSNRNWEIGQLEFDDELLPIAVERVNRYATARRIQVAPDASAIRISGTFNAGDIDAFATGVTVAFPVRKVVTADQITLVKSD
ncbi:FecR family protein [Asticcacaulis benevestitus]|uniref:FecR protein domain-containing protein n=1 Tax=Asticcacaulis benevestitus DSM 16100 = ATCC BAA-896 TaxID=1121022 RepID=V4PGH4_9CAUL|nr:FecR domain-containing protein [Asticcacaulis benevestitus]ESQ87261.1 hypothetical protein ABENE_17310 [Asticcacaulis benevestitus DSM 16100 = ATCC BAA-896]